MAGHESARGRDFGTVLAAAKRGAEWAFEAIYEDLRGPVYSYLFARARQDAEDLTSDVFVAVVTGLGRFDGDAAAFRSWVFTIAHHRLTDHARRLSRRRTFPVSHDEFTARPNRSDTEAEVIRALDADAALRRIAALPVAQAEVLFLRAVAELSVEEVAQIVGRRAGAVRALQLRALRRLARELIVEDP